MYSYYVCGVCACVYYMYTSYTYCIPIYPYAYACIYVYACISMCKYYVCNNIIMIVMGEI